MRNIIVPSLVSPSTADWQRVSTLTAVTIERERDRERERAQRVLEIISVSMALSPRCYLVTSQQIFEGKIEII